MAIQSPDVEKKEPEKKEPKLLDRMREAARVRHLSLRTEKAYVHWAKRYILFHGKKHPQEMGEAEINAFLTHLAVEGRVSASTQTQALCALLFLYRTVLSREVGELEGLVRARRKRKLPVVLTIEEVKRILAGVTGTERLFLSLLYGTGMRLTEALRLRVKDIDFAYGQITVRDGKGAKDRVTMLPSSLEQDLKAHLKEVKRLHEADLAAGHGQVYLPHALARKYSRAAGEWGWQYVFPAPGLSRDPRTGERRRHHLHERGIQRSGLWSLRLRGAAVPCMGRSLSSQTLSRFRERRMIDSTFLFDRVSINS